MHIFGARFVSFLFLGDVSERQGWELKRLVSFCKNRLVNRPNRPRDPMLRSFMGEIGVQWAESESSDGEDTEEEEDEDSDETDQEEEAEEKTLDPMPVADMSSPKGSTYEGDDVLKSGVSKTGLGSKVFSSIALCSTRMGQSISIAFILISDSYCFSLDSIINIKYLEKTFLIHLCPSLPMKVMLVRVLPVHLCPVLLSLLWGMLACLWSPRRPNTRSLPL